MTKKIFQCLCVAAFSFISLNAIAQVAEDKGYDDTPGSLFDLLNGSGKGSETSPEEPDAKKENQGGILGGLSGLLNHDLVDDIAGSVDSGIEMAGDLIGSSGEVNEKIEQLLGYVDRKIAGREPAYSEEEVRAYAEQIIPIVEELAGREFDEKPEIEAVGNLQMIQILAGDLLPQIRNRLPEVPEPILYLQAYLSAGVWAPSLLGKYGVQDGKVYILTENIHALTESKAIDPEYEEDILQLVIGHELTHGLQDQEIGLGDSILKAEDPDAMNAFNATIEGHAMLVEGQLAEQLGMGEASIQAANLIVAGDLDEDAWLYERLAHVDSVQMEQVYLGGERFMSHHYEVGGQERLWELLASPPRRSSMITQPETYSATPEALPDYERIFASVLSVSGLSGWSQMSCHLGDFDLRGRLASVKGEQRESILRGLDRAAVVMLVNDRNLQRAVEIAVFEFQSESEADLMIGAVESLQDADLLMISESAGVRLLSQSEGSYFAGGGLDGQFLQIVTDAPFVGQSKSTNVAVKKGSTVVVLYDTESGMSKSQVDAVLRTVADRMTQLSN